MSFARKSRFLFVLLVLPVLASGCGKKVEDPETMRLNGELGEIYESYRDYAKRNQRPPKQMSELNQKDYQAIYPLGLNALKDGRYVAVWGVDVSGKGSGAVLAYEKDAPKQGGAVVLANGTVKKMSADELQAALKAKG